MSNHMPVKQITKISRQIFRKVQLSMIEPGRNRNYEQANHKQWNKNCKKKNLPLQQKLKSRWVHRWILSNIFWGANAYPLQTLSKNWREMNSSKIYK